MLVKQYTKQISEKQRYEARQVRVTTTAPDYLAGREGPAIREAGAHHDHIVAGLIPEGAVERERRNEERVERG
jgi:hypothetical protein